MDLTSQQTISIHGGLNEGESIAIVRVVQKQVALSVSQEDNGDVEVFLDEESCLKLIAALQRALSAAEPEARKEADA